MHLKKYQEETLDTLKKFLIQAKYGDNEAAFTECQDAEGYNQKYQPLKELEKVPYVCLRLPTGGGKTLIGTHAIKLAAEKYIEREFPFVLWLVPSNEIRRQTLRVLRDVENFYSQFLYEKFQYKVNIFDVTEFRKLRPKDLTQALNICVATFHSLRVDDKEGRKVYQPDEEIGACFAEIGRQDYFQVDAKGRYESFANLLSYMRPLMIVDEAHNYSTELSFDITKILRPSAVIELTATPAENSNVLVSVSAEELKNEEMIKLPIRLDEISNSPEKTLDYAVQQRAALEQLALSEFQYLRPIALYQAESKDKTYTVEFVKKYLIEGAKVPESEIAIATGEKNELRGKDLFSRDCPIRHIITVQALKEGWDCPFASVFCSLANTHSAKDAEQLLGRVLRMPYAKRRRAEELNKAYAFFRVESWREAISKLKGYLFEMGFNEEEIQRALDIQPKLFTAEELSTVTNQGLFRTSAAKSPAERGVKFSIPQLCMDFGDGVKVVKHDDFYPADGWTITETHDYELPLSKSRSDVMSYELNVRGRRVTERRLDDKQQSLFKGKTNWTLTELIGYLVGAIDDKFIARYDLAEYTRRALSQLIDGKNFSLEDLVIERFSIKILLEEKIAQLKDAACKKNWQTVLDKKPLPKFKVGKSIEFSFNPSVYPAKKFYQGSVEFSKHFYHSVGDMNAEEIFCAQCIDANPNVETWIRNIEREPAYSFWLPTHKGRFYPDFVVKLKDGTFAVVEYKGEALKTTEDTKEKNLLGKLWALNNEPCKFLMAVKRDEHGRDISLQIKDLLS